MTINLTCPSSLQQPFISDQDHQFETQWYSQHRCVNFAFGSDSGCRHTRRRPDCRFAALLFETISCVSQAFSSSSSRVCFCGQTVPRSVRAHLRSQRSLRVCAEEGSQTRTEQETSQSSSNGSGPPQPDQPSENKKQGPRLSFAPNTRSVSTSNTSCRHQA